MPETTGETSDEGRKLLRALAGVDRPGTFCTSGSTPGVLPGLEVKGVGPIALPLVAAQARELIRACAQAGYGKGTETVVDPKVRRVWKLRADQFKLENPDWTPLLDEMVAHAARELGLEGRGLTANLYDLLLYEKGGFFLPHRDGERLDGMVATLVVTLPSTYAGGELVVRHEGRERVIDFASEGQTESRVNYAAFYADCEHEVRPLRSGHRLSLVYNLMLPKRAKAVAAPKMGEHVAKVAEVLNAWRADAAGPQKLAVTLEHQYTQDGLDWSTLKGADRGRASVLETAARQAGFHVHLALLSLWESGSVAYDGDYGSGRRRRGRYYDGYDENEPDDDREYVMEEFYDSGLTAEHWRDPDGARPAYGQVPVEPDEVVPAEKLRAVKPQQNYEGYTGNEGLTLERWYRHGAIVLWPAEHHFDVMCAASPRQAVPALNEMIKAWKRATRADAAAQREQCRAFAERIIANWPEDQPYNYYRRADATPVGDLAPALAALGDAALLGAFVRGPLARDASLDPGPELVEAIAQAGWAALIEPLKALFKSTRGPTLARNVRQLGRLCDSAFGTAGEKTTKGKAKAKAKERAQDGADACRNSIDALVAAQARIDAKEERDEWWVRREVDRAAVLAGLARAALRAGADDALARVVAHAQTNLKLYPLRAAQVPALLELAGWRHARAMRGSASLLAWVRDCERQLEEFTAVAPEPPTDFRREATVTCKCADCGALGRFLADPKAEEHGFQMAEARRRHLEDQIRHGGCDVACRTDRKPRPQVLVCSKNTASHDRRVAQYKEDLKHLAALKTLEADVA